ncbi:MAG TPA: hypothetical protein VLC07_05130 [Solirubrobacterales bacterium]|nr:hypothetical protein [Solirubrobacterales bacterium]
MLRLTRRAALLFSAYLGLILAVVIAGFLGAALGIWASVLWGAAVLAGLTFPVRRRLQRRSDGQPSNPNDQAPLP